MRNRSLTVATIALGICLTSALVSVPAHSAATFVVASNLADGRIQVFAIQPNGQIQTRWKTSPDPNSAWTGWSNFQTPPGRVTTISVAYLSDRRPQLFAAMTNGDIVTCWTVSTDSGSAWSDWSAF
jgi:hypothetical protein